MKIIKEEPNFKPITIVLENELEVDILTQIILWADENKINNDLMGYNKNSKTNITIVKDFLDNLYAELKLNN